MVQPLLHLSTHHTHFRRRRSLPPPARSQSDVHIIFRVTSTYMTSTCNQYNHRTPMPHAPVILFFSHRLYALYPLIYQLRPSFFLIIALHVSFPFCNFFKRAHLVSSRSSPLYRSYSHFLSRFFFFCKGRAAFFFFFFIPVVIVIFGVAAEAIEAGASSRIASVEVVYILSSLSTLTCVRAACQKTFVLKRSISWCRGPCHDFLCIFLFEIRYIYPACRLASWEYSLSHVETVTRYSRPAATAGLVANHLSSTP